MLYRKKTKPHPHKKKRTRRSLLLEALEPRIVLSGVPELMDLNPYSASAPSEFTQVGDVAFFVADDGTHGRELWKTDGTAAGTALVKDIYTGTTWDSYAYSYLPNSSNPLGLAESNGKLFFSADDGINGRELWMSDGTASGTVMVRDLLAGTTWDSNTYSYLPRSSDPQNLTDVNGKLFFTADDGVNGIELWKTDGTSAGTVMVKDIATGTYWDRDAYSYVPSASAPEDLVNVNGILFFSANNYNDGSGRELWKSDGTSSGTVLVKDLFTGTYVDNYGYDYPNNSYPSELTASDGQLFFVAQDESNGSELWKSDGTEAGTVLVKDIHPGSGYQSYYGYAPNSSSPQELVEVGGKLLFIANDGVHGEELWISDGTNAGTNVLKDIQAGSEGNLSNYSGFTVVDDTLFFSANDGVYGRELWRSDGTATGTVMVKDINPGTETYYGTPNNSYPFYMGTVDGILYFSAHSDTCGRELWRSDGTEEGTALVEDTVPGTDGLHPTFLASANGILIFSGDTDGYSSELWVLEPEAEDTTGEITGAKFFDTDGDGVFDAEETSVSGITVYVDANNNGVLDTGEISTITDADGQYLLLVESGTHIVRAEVSAGHYTTLPAVTSYNVTVEIGHESADVDFGEAELPPPASADLLAATDSGAADDDNLTNFNNSTTATALQFQVDGVVDAAEVRIFRDGVQIGSGTASAGIAIVNTDGATVLADGTYNITATQVLNGGESAASTALAITIDTMPPAAIASTAPNVAQAELAYSFDADSPDEGQTGVSYSLADEPADMTIDSATGVASWTPSTEQAVPQSFSIRVTDAAGNMTEQAVALTVLGVIPAYPDEYSVDEDTTLNIDAAIGVLVNDGDENSGTLTATIVDPPANGTVTLNADGSFTYSPNGNFFGEDSFTYRATDGIDDSNVAKARIQVVGVNDPASPVADSYSATEDTLLVVDAATGVLANDTDPDGDALIAAISSQPTGGTVVLNSDGSFTYTPNADSYGTDSFAYTVNDGTDTSSPVTVSVAVAEVNDPPTGAADSYSVNEDEVLSVAASSGVLANDVDPEGAALTATISSQPAHGTVTMNGDGSFTYTPTANFYGTDSFIYVAGDGAGSSSWITVTVNVNSQADPPSAVDDVLSVSNAETSQTLDVLDNDTSAPDLGQTLTIIEVTQGSAGGVVTFSSGSLSYTPPSGFTGAETFNYTIQDSDGLTDTAAVTVTVTEAASNRLSGYVYVDSNENGIRETPEIGVPGSVISLTGTSSAGEAVSRSAITPSSGFYAFDELPSGTYQLTQTQPMALLDSSDATSVPNALAGNDQITDIVLSGNQDFAGNDFGEMGLHPEYISICWFLTSSPPPGVMFLEAIALAEERAGNTDLAATIRAGGTTVPENVNTSPIASGDSYSGAETGTLSVTAASGVLVNDSDADGDLLIAQLASPPANGVLTLNSDGSFTYTPNVDFNGSDSFTYQASDGQLTSNTATVTIIVNAVNDSPVASADSYTATEDQALSIVASSGVLANDSDADGDSLTAQLVSSPANGSVMLNSDGSFTYTPFVDFTGSDSFTYRASDGQLTSNTATVTIVVNAVNDSPVASADSYTATEDQTLSIAASSGVLANDSDADGDSLTAQLVGSPANGVLTLNSDGSFTYTPNANFHGSDSFSYQASDGTQASNVVAVTIVVNIANDTPAATGDSYSMDEDGILAIDAVFGLLANDSNRDGDVLQASAVDLPVNGQVTLNTDGSFTYTPDANFSGVDTFTYQANDGSLTSDVTTVSINIAEINDPSAIVLPAEFTDPNMVPVWTVGQTIDFNVTVDDPDDADYVYQLDLESSGIPEGEAMPTIDATTGRFLWTPSATGRFEIRVIVVNGNGDADQETFLIDIVAE